MRSVTQLQLRHHLLYRGRAASAAVGRPAVSLGANVGAAHGRAVDRREPFGREGRCGQHPVRAHVDGATHLETDHHAGSPRLDDVGDADHRCAFH